MRVADLTCVGLDCLTPADLAAAHRLGGVLKPVALASLDAKAPGAWVGPVFVPNPHAFASLAGVDNALAITACNGHTVRSAGPGAGPDVTAITIIDDIVEAVTAYEPPEDFGRSAARAIDPRSAA